MSLGLRIKRFGFSPLGVKAIYTFALACLLSTSASAQPKMIFIGDSITAGLGASSPDENGFVAQLADRFPEIAVVNAGCSGSTVRDWTNDEPDVSCALSDAWNLLVEPELPARLFHIMLGTNDATGFFELFPDDTMGRWVSPDEFELRLRSLVDRATDLVLISTPPKNFFELTGPADDRLLAYRERIFTVVESNAHAELGADVYDLLDPTTDLDGVHPNDRGHSIIADELERQILNVLRSRRLFPCVDGAACDLDDLLPGLVPGGQPIGLGPMPGPGRP